MSRTCQHALLTAAVGFLGGGLWAPAAAQGVAAQGVVAGTVVRSGTLVPVEGAQIQVEGTTLGAMTDAAGRFRIANVPGERARLQVRRISFAPTTVEVRVGATDVRVVLGETTVRLDEVVVTGTAAGELRRSIGNSVATISAAEELERSAAPTVTTLIQSRAAGVIVTPATGRVGAGPTIQIRGRSSLSLSTEPIIYVDGVRVNNAVNQGPPGVGSLSLGTQNSQTASRLNDIDPESIESIEIIKGPAAATIYGTEAANGVVHIITKKGVAGRPQWSAKVEQGTAWFQNPEGRIPTNYARCGANDVLPTGYEPCRGQAVGTVVGWNPIQQERDSLRPIFRNGRTQSYGLSLSGGREALTFYLGGTYNDNAGIEPNNFGKDFNAHANLNVAPNERLFIASNLHYHRSALHLGADGGLSPMLGMAIGHPINNPSTRGFFFAPPEVPQQLYDNAQDINRYTGGLTVNHRPANWFTQRLILGIDYTSDDSRALERYAPPELRRFFTAAIGGPVTADGRIAQTLRNHSYITGDYSGTATANLTSAISSASSIGGQFIRKELDESRLSGIVFPGPGVETVSGTSQPGTPTQTLIVNTTVGFYAQQRFGWHDRLFLTGAVRVDNNSAFGEELDLVTYPKVSASWVVSEEPFWTRFGRTVNNLKLRAAYGQSGQQPNAFAALRTLTNAPRANGTAGVTPGSPGNLDLKPERGTELELGFEASLLDRLSLDFTYYTRRTKDAILERDLAPSSGFSEDQFVNIGETSNRGVELQARLQALARENLSWEIGGNISTNRDRVEDMGGIPPATGVVRSVEGYPIGGLWTKTIASATRDPATHAISNIVCNNGPPSTGAPAPCAQAFAVFVGTPTPKVTGAISNTLTIGNRVTLYGLVDFKRGHRILNANDSNRCGLNVCEARFFPERYSTEYLAAIAQASISAGVLEPFIQDASFVKLREISASFHIPERWLTRTRASRATLVLAGRNLATWSDYNGIDPEVRYQGTQPQDQGLVPALTQFVATLNLRF